MGKCFAEMTISERIEALTGEEGKSLQQIGREHGMAVRNLTRYIRCGRLIPGLKAMLDDGSLTIIAGVELSYLSEKEQRRVERVLERNCMSIGVDDAKRLRGAAGSITESTVEVVLGVDKPVEPAASKGSVSIRLPGKVYRRFFADVAAKDVRGIVEEALDQYYMRKGA